VELLPWLGVRGLVVAARHPVSVQPGGLGPATDTRVEQPSLQVTLLAAQVEPTWVVLPQLRLWMAFGAGWGSIVAPAPEAQDPTIRSARRTGVLIELASSLGATFDFVPNWFSGSLVLSAGLIAEQSGEVFDRVQAFEQDPTAERIDYFDGLPGFASSCSVLATLGLIL
jgi:hypothetical protein